MKIENEEATFLKSHAKKRIPHKKCGFLSATPPLMESVFFLIEQLFSSLCEENRKQAGAEPAY